MTPLSFFSWCELTDYLLFFAGDVSTVVGVQIPTGPLRRFFITICAIWAVISGIYP